MAKKKIIDDTPDFIENIQHQSLDFVMSDRYAVYAKYVIQDRAIPDARDGLKPVQRRIIFSMYQNGNTFDKPTKKCATIVGAVMGKLHPHGDTSIYDALVRMSQPWKMNMPLIKFQGNNGSIDNDPAAAYRYTEAKLNEFAMNLVKDLEKDTVDMTLNFDDTELEPIVLPSRFPNLFLNGSEGIAVAIATEIPPHNLKELIEATIYRIAHQHCTIEELMEIVKGPDFPTGGIIYNSQGLKDIYLTGKGRIEIASKVNIVEGKSQNELIISEIPYKVNKQELVHSIDKIMKSKEIDGILEVLDESAGEEIKISVALKKEADPNKVLTYLFNKTQLKVGYSANIVAISDNRPKTLTLLDYLDTYIAHQIDVITRRTKYDVEIAKNRLHIVDGLIKAVNIIEEVVELIRHSKDKRDAKDNLIAKYGFTEEQSEAIVMMHLYRLSNADITIYLNEKANLEKSISEFNEILSDEKKLRKIIIKDLKEISDKYGVDRRTEIIEQEDSQEVSISKRDLILKEDVYIVLTKAGYAKRSSLKSYKASNGMLPGTKEGDTIVLQAVANTADYVLAFTDKGNCLFLPVHEFSEGKWKDEGKHINSICTVPMNEKIIKTFIVKDFNKKVNIVFVSANGQIKKTPLKEFYVTKYNKPIQCMKLMKNDFVTDVCIANGNSDLFIVAKNGLGTFFNESEITATGLKTSGVKSISTLRNSTVCGVFSYRKEEKGKLIIITDRGMYRVFDKSNLELTQRLGRTQVIFKSFKSEPHDIAYINKISKRAEALTLNALMSDNSIIELNINDLHLTPMDKMCRKNLEFNDKLKICDVFTETVQHIDENTIEEEPVERATNKPINLFTEEAEDVPEKDVEYEQISIFDDMGD
ncbi:MAG: DNA topoisomerase IV subunit A [Bacilli bacterium]|nr:DNA topoisomerase IV subunit A [Bacilli bacterium]